MFFGLSEERWQRQAVANDSDAGLAPSSVQVQVFGCLVDNNKRFGVQPRHSNSQPFL